MFCSVTGYACRFSEYLQFTTTTTIVVIVIIVVVVVVVIVVVVNVPTMRSHS